jgi:hypothetical protein
MLKIINLSENGRENIQSRDEVTLLFDLDYKEVTALIFNFENINFISRSPAHEFIKQTGLVKNLYGVDCEFKNMNEDVEKMFDIIKKSGLTARQRINKVISNNPNEFHDLISTW